MFWTLPPASDKPVTQFAGCSSISDGITTPSGGLATCSRAVTTRLGTVYCPSSFRRSSALSAARCATSFSLAANSSGV